MNLGLLGGGEEGAYRGYRIWPGLFGLMVQGTEDRNILKLLYTEDGGRVEEFEIFLL